MGKRSNIRYQLVCLSCVPSRILDFKASLTVWGCGTVSHVSVQMTRHTLPCPRSTSDSSCLCFSCRGWGHDKMMKLITHIIHGSAPFAERVYMNGSQWLIYILIFNPVSCTWARESPSFQSNLRHEHVRNPTHYKSHVRSQFNSKYSTIFIM